MIALSIFTIGYWIVEYPDLVNRAGNYNRLDIFVGAVAIVISFEVSRRTVGWGTPYHRNGRHPIRPFWQVYARML